MEAPSRWRVSTAEYIKREKGVSLKTESQQCFIPKTSLKNVTSMVFWARAQTSVDDKNTCLHAQGLDKNLKVEGKQISTLNCQ